MLLAAASKDRCPWIVKPAASSRGRGIFLIMSVRSSSDFAYGSYSCVESQLSAFYYYCHLTDMMCMVWTCFKYMEYEIEGVTLRNMCGLSALCPRGAFWNSAIVCLSVRLSVCPMA